MHKNGVTSIIFQFFKKCFYIYQSQPKISPFTKFGEKRLSCQLMKSSTSDFHNAHFNDLEILRQHYYKKSEKMVEAFEFTFCMKGVLLLIKR